MLSSKRIAKLTRDIKKVYGSKEYQKIIVKAKEGLFLFNLKANSPGDKRKKIREVIPECNVDDLSSTSIEDILVVGDGTTIPIVIYGKLEDNHIIKEYANESNILNFKELTNEELKNVIKACED